MKKTNGISEKIHNESGFTLVEITITVAIVVIAAGLSGFGLNAVFNANLDNMAHDIATDLRNVRFRAVSEFDAEYQLVLTYDGGNDRYGYEVQRLKAGTTTVTRSETYRSTLIILREDISGTWIELNDPSIDITNNPELGTFCFNTSTGGISEYVMGSTTVNVASLNLNLNTLGRYKIINERNNEEIRFDVVKLTGRVVIYD